VAAHLNDIQPRPRLRVFGEPMLFWSGNMPLGMLLRSPWVASNLSDPKGALTLDAFRSEQGLQFEAPIPLDCFTSYGHWFQQRAVPEVDSRKVTNIESSSATYVVTLADGEQVWAKRVIVATGIGYFPNGPAPFRDLPSELASHSSAHRDLRPFGGRDVAGIGAGQRALQSARVPPERARRT